MSRILEALSPFEYEYFTEHGRLPEKRMFDPSKFDQVGYDSGDTVPLPFEMDEEVTDETVVEKTNSKQSDLCDKYLVDLSKEYPEIEYTLEINGVATFPKGNLQAIKAKAKSGKTHVNICLMTALLSGKFLAIESLIDEPKICYFATEEHISSVFNLNKKVHKLCGWDTEHSYERFKVYSIREAETAKRIEIIGEVIEKEKPDVIFLDGVRDLLIDFNNIQQSHEIIDLLMLIAGEYNCAVVCVLHTNKAQSDFQMRGHLGTELLNKSSDVLEVTKSENNFIVRHTDSRSVETGEWAFCFDEEGLLKAGEIPNKTQDKAERIKKMEGCFSKILSEYKSLRHSDLKEKYMSLANIGKEAAIKHIKEMTNNGFLKKRDDDGKYELG